MRSGSSSDLNRRAFLEALVGFGALYLDACSSSDGNDENAPEPGNAVCASDLVLGGRIPFLDEGQQALEVAVGEGHDGRLYTDLSKLTASSLIIDSARFYVRTNRPDRIDYAKPWTLRIGDVLDVPVTEIFALGDGVERTTLLECSGNARGGSFGLMSVARWRGAPIDRVLARLGGDAASNPNARILVSGFDDDSHPSTHSVNGASWIFTRDQLLKANAFLAFEMNGAPLPEAHGFPVRLIVPNWYGCTCIKWVNELRVVGDDEPSTAQMIEFASRTHQQGEPALARDYQPAEIDLAAMPIRIDRLKQNQTVLITGLYWGGQQGLLPSPPLEVRVGNLEARAVQLCTPRADLDSWGLWSVALAVPAGTYDVSLRCSDKSVRTRRLDSGFYVRSFKI